MLAAGVATFALGAAVSPLLSRVLDLNDVGGLLLVAVTFVPFAVTGAQLGLLQGYEQHSRLGTLYVAVHPRPRRRGDRRRPHRADRRLGDAGAGPRCIAGRPPRALHARRAPGVALRGGHAAVPGRGRSRCARTDRPVRADQPRRPDRARAAARVRRRPLRRRRAGGPRGVLLPAGDPGGGLPEDRRGGTQRPASGRRRGGRTRTAGHCLRRPVPHPGHHHLRRRAVPGRCRRGVDLRAGGRWLRRGAGAAVRADGPQRWPRDHPAVDGSGGAGRPRPDARDVDQRPGHVRRRRCLDDRPDGGRMGAAGSSPGRGGRALPPAAL